MSRARQHAHPAKAFRASNKYQAAGAEQWCVCARSPPRTWNFQRICSQLSMSVMGPSMPAAVSTCTGRGREQHTTQLLPLRRARRPFPPLHSSHGTPRALLHGEGVPCDSTLGTRSAVRHTGPRARGLAAAAAAQARAHRARNEGGEPTAGDDRQAHVPRLRPIRRASCPWGRRRHRHLVDATAVAHRHRTQSGQAGAAVVGHAGARASAHGAFPRGRARRSRQRACAAQPPAPWPSRHSPPSVVVVLLVEDVSTHSMNTHEL